MKIGNFMALALEGDGNQRRGIHDTERKSLWVVPSSNS